jgi:hypothetical protein
MGYSSLMSSSPNSTTLSNYNINPYAVGNKVYGGGRSFPTMGPVDPMGYAERDLRAKAQRDAMLRRMKSNMRGDFGSANSQRSI